MSHKNHNIESFWQDFLKEKGMDPKCVIETTNVRILPFKDVTYDICKLEGEDDSLESWRKGHISFFKEEGKKSGYEFSEEMPVVFEEFEVVYQR